MKVKKKEKTKIMKQQNKYIYTNRKKLQVSIKGKKDNKK